MRDMWRYANVASLRLWVKKTFDLLPRVCLKINVEVLRADGISIVSQVFDLKWFEIKPD